MAGPVTAAAAEQHRSAPRREPALAVSHLTKSFPAAGRSTLPLKRILRGPLAAFDRRRVGILSDLSFEVERGEFFAIVGSNGSGKSTLLRCIAGIYEPEGGEIAVNGRVAPFIELGASFHPDLDAADNIALVGTLIGLDPAQARRRTPEILEFAELEGFAEMPLRNYSSGMEARLAFALSLSAEADVLLFDEALAVGDVAFRERSFATFERLRAEGRTVLYVSHQLETVSRFADRAILLERGREPRIGQPRAILAEYRQRSTRGLGEAGRSGLAAPEQASGPGGRVAQTRTSGEWRRFLQATRALGIAEYKVRYLDSMLGYLWALLQPLLLFAVLYFVFSQVASFEDASHYPVQLLLGVVLFNHFTEATGLALPSLVVRANLLRRIAFPPAAVPSGSALTSALTFAVGLLLALVFAVLSGVAVGPRWLEVVPLAAALTLFTAAASLILALLFVTLRDARPIWSVLTRVLFFATPVFYPIEAVPEGLRHLLMANPVAVVIVETRDALGLGGPSVTEAAGGAELLLVPASLAVALPCLAAWLYRRQRNLPERL